MGFNRDFIRARIGDNGKDVRVDATSSVDGVPTAGDPATAISVAIVSLPKFDEKVVSAPVEMPVGAQWEANFPGAAKQLKGTTQIYVIGTARDPELDDAYVWGKVVQLSSRAKP